jgi:hypothetical protein
MSTKEERLVVFKNLFDSLSLSQGGLSVWMYHKNIGSLFPTDEGRKALKTQNIFIVGGLVDDEGEYNYIQFNADNGEYTLIKIREIIDPSKVQLSKCLNDQ